ncbi:hypothetical protein RBU61_18995 [Tissierella sp. MB52-C2]|uniref:ABC transporter permease n=1 Tax=Tissierella sp. MB52-C2 TaxID=3070999 RepID=UPI00280A5357|nr:ABC transporter permease [Tissierella sp. MB52-C2]WMM24989.1 hypothetical protein RBU61_18995 [Tissierella sp. MB52-C2]
MENRIKKFQIESKKYRHLYIPIIFFLFLCMDIGTVLMTALDSRFQSKINYLESYPWLQLLNSYLIAKLIFTPTLLSVVISRMVEIENTGHMWKMLKTSGWTVEEIFNIKFLSIFKKYTVFQMLEWILFLQVGKTVGITIPIPTERFIITLLSIMAISFAIMTFHYFLSMVCENQLISLAFGVCGSLAGIIGTLLPLSISKFIPYSYYAHLLSTEYVRIGESQWIQKEVPLRLYPLLVSLLLGGFVFLWSRRKIKGLDI